MNYIVTRFTEASTYASLSAILGVAGVNIPHGIWQTAVFVAAAAAGLIGVFVKDGVIKAFESGDFIQPFENASSISGAYK